MAKAEDVAVAAVSSAAVPVPELDPDPAPLVVDGVSVPVTVVKPSATTAPEPEPEVEVEVEDEPEPEPETAAPVASGAAESMLSVATTPCTLATPPEDELAVVVESELLPVLVVVLLDESEDVESVEVSPEVVSLDDVDAEEPDVSLDVVEELVESSWLLTVIWQFCSSWTKFSPLGPCTGVNVTSHVVVTVPAEVLAVFTVCTVCGPEKAPLLFWRM